MHTVSSVFPTMWLRVPKTPVRLAHAIGIPLAMATSILEACLRFVNVPKKVPIGAHPLHTNANAPLDCVKHAVVACLSNHKTQLLSTFPSTHMSLQDAADWLHRRNLATLMHLPTREQLAIAIQSNPHSHFIVRCEMATDGSTTHCVALSPVSTKKHGCRTLSDGQANHALLCTTHNLRHAGITAFVEGMLVLPLV